MSRQKYTRWRASDEDYDDEPEENGQLGELRDEDELEARRVFTLMTPQRDAAPPPSSTLKYICIGVLMCVFCIIGGALIGFFVGSTRLPVPAAPSAASKPPSIITTTTTPRPSVQPKPTCEDQDPVRSSEAIAINFLPHVKLDKLKQYIAEISQQKPGNLAKYLLSTLSKLGYKTNDEVYSVATSYSPHNTPPKLEIMYDDGTVKSLKGNISSDVTRISFNGYSANGSADGSLVYGHYGTTDDFNLLKEENVALNNSIMLIRLGEFHPGDQVRNAEEHGVKAVLLYPDPDDFGGNDFYPHGNALPLDGVINYNLRIPTGDPSTVGYASGNNAFRLPVQNFTDVPKIPVLSISANDANTLLKTLNGKTAYHWDGGLNATYTLGGSFRRDTDTNVTAVKVTVFSDIGTATVRPVHAYLPAKDTANVVHVGVHYDTTIDPIPGSGISLAAWLTFAESLVSFSGNSTRRMVYLSAFPGTERDYSGGGEFTELHRNWLDSTGVAYIDFDNIISGRGFFDARVSPILQKVVQNTMKHVPWPNEEKTSVLSGLISKSTELEDSKNIKVMHLQEPSLCGESQNFGINLGIPTFHISAVNVTKSKYYLKNSQYDTLNTAVNILDSDLKWTHTATSLLSMGTVLLLESRMPDIDMAHVSRDLENRWMEFSRSASLLSSNYSLKEISGSIKDGFDMIKNKLDKITLWFQDIEQEKEKNNSKIERELDRMKALRLIERQFLRPANIPSPTISGSLLTYGSSANDSCKPTYYPMAKKVLSEVLAGKKNWTELHKEFSLILSAVSSLISTPILNS